MAAEKSKKPAGKTTTKTPVDPKARKKEEAKARKKERDKAAAAAAPAPEAKKAPEPERKPADPRLKFMKKFRGRFLPKGPLRDRHKEILARWDSGEDHGGITVEELKSLFDDWKASRQKPAQTASV